MYKSLWYDSTQKEIMINTRNPDGSLRSIDDMGDVYSTFCKFKRNSSSLHNWGGHHGDHECMKCRNWVPGYTLHTELPQRGCNHSHALVRIQNET